MIIQINHKYLLFPVNTLSTKKKMVFKRQDKTVYSLDIKLDNVAPNFYAYIDMSRFIGQKIDVSVTPQMSIEYRCSDEFDIEGLYREPMRPQIHYTTKNGWINDPNGLIYLDGVYHMFYQYNPADSSWGNMHWGHAESRDLIHWEEKDTALFPDERGTMFSGCAVCDEKNLIKVNNDNTKTALLYYTTTGPFCQHMSYSTDNFQTIVKYSEQPIIPHIVASNRDPKVVFCDELDCYIMALYLTEDIYCILKSHDLTDWTELQRIRLEGDNECPDIFPLTDSESNRKWILMGAHDKYLVGSFDGGSFTADQKVLPLHYGNSGYAGQTFNNLPCGRVVRVVWDRWNLPTVNFKGQMGIPMQMSIEKFRDTYYLQAHPVDEIKGIYNNSKKFENVRITKHTDFSEIIEDSALLLKIKSSLYDNVMLSLKIFGRTISFDFKRNEIKIGNCISPITLTHRNFDLTVIVDRCSMELFADNGKITMSCTDNNTLCDRNIPYLIISSDSDYDIESIEINSLKSIWDK